MIQYKKIIIILIILVMNKVHAERIITIYFCKLDDGTIGYYDLPCDHIVNFKLKDFKNYNLIQEEIIHIKSSNNKIMNKLDHDDLYLNDKMLIDHEKNRKLKIAKQRCKTAKLKIPSLMQLLKDPKNIAKQKIKIKRSLYRYKKIVKNYCSSNS